MCVCDPCVGPCVASPFEEQLIAMGMEQFTPYCKELLLNSNKDVLNKTVCSMISHYMLPHWSPKQISIRIARLSKYKTDNPVKVSRHLDRFNLEIIVLKIFVFQYYKKNNVAPPVSHSVAPFDRYSLPKLCDVDASILPDRWRLLLLEADGRCHRSNIKAVHRARPMISLENTHSTPVSSRKPRRQRKPKSSVPKDTTSPVALNGPQQVVSDEPYYIIINPDDPQQPPTDPNQIPVSLADAVALLVSL